MTMMTKTKTSAAVRRCLRGLAVPRTALLIGFLSVAGLAWTPAVSPLHALQKKEPTVRTVEGKVLDKGDKPVANAVVYIKDTKSLAIKSYLTDEDGNFRFGQLSLSTDYDVWAEHEGVHSKTKSISSFNSRPNLNYTLKIDK